MHKFITMLQRRSVIALVALLAHPMAAFALQIITPLEGQNTYIKVSAKNDTRFVVQGGRIKSLLYADGELSVQKDEASGQAYIVPLVKDRPIAARLITAQDSVWSLILQPVDIPSEDVILHDSKLEKASTSLASTGTTVGEVKKASVREMMHVMLKGDPPLSYEFKALNSEIKLWEGTRLRLLGEYRDRSGLVGELYLLDNTSTKPIELREQEFFRRRVVGIAVVTHSLAAGANTRVLVVREP
jgi:hypothetical protein